MKICIKLVCLCSSLVAINCYYDRPSIIEIVVPYVNDSGSPKKINIYVRYHTVNPSSDTAAWAEFSSHNSFSYGLSEPTSGSSSTNGLFYQDFFGDPMLNIVIPGNASGRNAGVIRRKIPTITGGDESSTYSISQLCDPLYFSSSACQIQTTSNVFQTAEIVNSPQGIADWKRIYLSWDYWYPSGARNLTLPNTISISALPPPDPQVCHTYTYRTPGCWFHWPWPLDYDDCYAWCDNCFSTGGYCDPITYSY